MDADGVFSLPLFFALLYIAQLFKSLTTYHFMKTLKIIFFKKQVTKILSPVSSKLDLCRRTSGFKSQHTAEIMCREAISQWRLIVATWEEITHRERERREGKQAQNWGASPLSEDGLA